jgi:UDP-N-acetylmuramoyl-tripeptide--D-alanyl-D-alanine ligase
VELTAAQLAHATGGEVLTGDADARATSFTIDSRLVEPGACFFALRGTRDGHQFLPDAFARGATLAVVARIVDGLPPDATLVRVPDVMEALAALGVLARRWLADATVVGITGSAGKTTTKDLTAAALRGSRRVHASPASYNNEAGVPLTLLGAPADAQVVVAEMGARFVGNIADLTAIARPTVGVVTHVGMAHAEHLGGPEGITQVKGELLEALPADGLAVLNADCDSVAELAARTVARVVRVGCADDADVRLRDVGLDEELHPRFTLDSPWGRASITLGLRGEHQAQNAAMAATVALALDTPLDAVVEGLADVPHASFRMELLRTTDGITVINDAYNSSPTSAAAAVRSLASLPVAGRRVAVLGEMRELGAYGDAEHVELGRLAGSAGIDLLVAVGEPASLLLEGARGSDAIVRVVPDATAAAELLLESLRPGDAVLVKASRTVGLEHIAHDLVQGRGQ